MTQDPNNSSDAVDASDGVFSIFLIDVELTAPQVASLFSLSGLRTSGSDVVVAKPRNPSSIASGASRFGRTGRIGRSIRRFSHKARSQSSLTAK